MNKGHPVKQTKDQAKIQLKMKEWKFVRVIQHQSWIAFFIYFLVTLSVDSVCIKSTIPVHILIY